MKQPVETKADCIRSCQQCYAACMTALAHCVQPEHARQLPDCAKSCQISAAFLLRNSPSAGYFRSVCARLCERGATKCARLGGLDECVVSYGKSAALYH